MISYTRLIRDHKPTDLTTSFCGFDRSHITIVSNSAESLCRSPYINKALGLCTSISDLIIGKILNKFGSSQFITDSVVWFTSHIER
ncbi:hypothetical protein D3C71_1080600 [compost metagenome]